MQEVTLLKTAPALEMALAGEIDAKNADEFYEEVEKGLGAGGKDVLFLCDKLEFIDSTTLGTFVKILKRVKADGHTMKLTGLSPRLKKLFVICALDTIMEIA